MAPWWAAKYALDIDDPDCYLLKVASPESSTTVVGLLSLHKYSADEEGAGRWSSFPPPSQIDRIKYDAMVNAMIEYRKKFMLSRAHFCIDHFGVDAEYQGHGLGKRLMARACDIADHEKLDIFVEANEFAECFYHMFGFKTEGKLEMPGGLTECFLVRHCQQCNRVRAGLSQDDRSRISDANKCKMITGTGNSVCWAVVLEDYPRPKNHQKHNQSSRQNISAQLACCVRFSLISEPMATSMKAVNEGASCVTT